MKSKRNQIYSQLYKFVQENPLPPSQAMDSYEHRLFRLLDRDGARKLTLDEAFAEMAEPFLLVESGLPQAWRRALNAAVKRGVLRHEPKSGLKPECYYSPRMDAPQRAMAAREERAAQIRQTLDTVLA
ncbi:hypothetical protein [Metapseudomonas otitidis]|uniref:hypothetical protein n=1 Tax=Metapseudomonas otitidis TaxID=319939 RepID=UPI0024486162|nr:hypothetical protein [Pseudomonas otitidis]MDH0335151.1 hypothetical protein [Pseudomonas otitidis]